MSNRTEALKETMAPFKTLERAERFLRLEAKATMQTAEPNWRDYIDRVGRMTTPVDAPEILGLSFEFIELVWRPLWNKRYEIGATYFHPMHLNEIIVAISRELDPAEPVGDAPRMGRVHVGDLMGLPMIADARCPKKEIIAVAQGSGLGVSVGKLVDRLVEPFEFRVHEKKTVWIETRLEYINALRKRRTADAWHRFHRATQPASA